MQIISHLQTELEHTECSEFHGLPLGFRHFTLTLGTFHFTSADKDRSKPSLSCHAKYTFFQVLITVILKIWLKYGWLQGCIISKETFFEYHMKQIFWILPGGLTANLPMQPYLGIIWIFYCIDSKWFITRNGKLKDTHYKDVKLNKANLI